MKKICKSVAVFAIMAGLLCATSYAKSLKDALGSTKLGEKLSEKVQQNEKLNKISGPKIGSGQQIAFLEGQNGAPYAFFRLYSNGKVEGATPDNSGVPIKGKWDSSKSTEAVKNGDTITVTIQDKTGKGNVRQISSKYIPLDPSTVDSAKPKGDYTLIKYSVNLGALGTYAWEEKKYESNK
ncbi:MAG: hypothetical protein K2J68_08895 [Treponemataceae bacterium]|nr:hypothetical protein [Treponemataceae bacterium]